MSTLTHCPTSLNHFILRPLVHLCNSLPRRDKEADLYFFKRMALVFLAFFSVALWTPPVAAATSPDTQIYFNDFSAGAGPEWSIPSTAIANGESFLGTSAYGFGPGSDSLTLSNLSPHSRVTVDFDLYIINSWDGNGPGGGGPDNWQLTADGTNLLFTNFVNFTGFGNTQASPNQLPPYGPGGPFPPRTGAFENGHLGWGIGDFGDSTYHFSFTFDHTAPSILLNFTSFQGNARILLLMNLNGKSKLITIYK